MNSAKNTGRKSGIQNEKDQSCSEKITTPGLSSDCNTSVAMCATETPVDLFIFHFDIKKAVKFGMKIGGPLGSTLRVEHDPDILCVLNAFCVMGTITQN